MWQIRHDGQINSDFQKSCQAPKAKIFSLYISVNQNYSYAVPCPYEGRLAIVTDTLGMGCGGRFGVRRVFTPDETPKAYGEVVWSWRRDAGVKLLRASFSQVTVTTSPLTGESTK